MSEFSYLGHIKCAESIKANLKRFNKFPEKVENPKTLKQLRYLLGFINCFTPITKMCMKISALTDKTKHGKGIEWTDDDTTAINEIFKEIKKNFLL